MADEIYYKLRDRMNQYTLGFATTKSGVEIKILEYLFTVEEVETYLNLEENVLQSVEETAAKMNRDPEEVGGILKRMAEKGLAYARFPEKEGDPVYYSACPWVHGIYENSTWRIDKTLAELYDQYFNEGAFTWTGQFPSRIVPVGEVVEAHASTIASYDDAKAIIKKKKIIAVAECACTAWRKKLGETCDKPSEVCLSFDFYAQYAIGIGIGRQITQEEALEILDKAEKAGLVHLFGDSFSPEVICNCCPKCCVGFGKLIPQVPAKVGTYINTNYFSQIDLEKCVACRKCEAICPTNAIAVKRLETAGTGARYVPPCEEACPAGINVSGYVALIGAGRETDAYNLILKNNPFPAVCGRVCTHPCELQCNRNKVDKPVAIRHLKRYITDTVFESYAPEGVKPFPGNGKSVGIIGAGPSGLSCGYYLALLGYDIDVYESQPIAGGVMAYGIPEYRIPRAVLGKEIKMIEQAGVKIHLNTEVGKDITFDELRKKHSAVYLAIGAQSSKKAGLPGEDMSGVYNGLDFLRSVSMGTPPRSGWRVAVIGGGNVAVDCALTSLRRGARNVTMVCLEPRDQMPAIEGDVVEALEDGVQLINGFGPKQIVGKRSKVSSVEFMRCTRVFDENGAFSPTYDPEDTIAIEADMVIVAIGQSPDLSFAKDLSAKGQLTADADTQMTSVEGVFAGGDIVRGSNICIAAIADGKNAARSIDKYLGGKGALNTGADIEIPERDITCLSCADDRQPLRRLDKIRRVSSFDEVVEGYSRENAIGEANRCMRCDMQLKEYVDRDKCIGCGLCVSICPVKAPSLNHREDRVCVPPKENIVWRSTEELEASIHGEKS